jgi:hypothetical protein
MSSVITCSDKTPSRVLPPLGKMATQLHQDKQRTLVKHNIEK